MKTRLFALSFLLPLSLLAAGDDAKQHDDHMATLKPAPALVAPDASGGLPVAYTKVGEKSVAGTLYKAARPRPGKPGVVVIHEWWGLNDEIRSKARELATTGIHALAVDLYGGEVATEAEGAKKLAGAARADGPGVVANLADAVAYLKRELGCTKVGVIGWCLGGGFALDLALARPKDVAAVVMYYGQVRTTAEALASLEAPVMGHFGALDQGIPIADVRKFRELLVARTKDNRVRVYKEAGHAFANPTRMDSYRAGDAAEAWRRSVGFLARNLVVRP